MGSLVPVATTAPVGLPPDGKEQFDGDVRVGQAKDVRLRDVGDPLDRSTSRRTETADRRLERRSRQPKVAGLEVEL